MDDPVLSETPLGFVWQTADPFLFCVHHDDAYPQGDARMAPPTADLAGRPLGQDFEGRDGWRMYHGRTVPGFPAHPHRGFETVTLVRRGFIDHADSLGAAARFGGGDVQWMTAGRGVVHSEMFPLLRRDGPNPLELFQIWLNLPRRSKLVEPHFAMLWSEQLPTLVYEDGGRAEVTLVAGALGEAAPPAPPPSSWAADPANGVAIWTLRMTPGARFTVPAAPGTQRVLYLFEGGPVRVGSRLAHGRKGLALHPEAEVPLHHTGEAPAELLLLQGRPIAEPVVQHGPFVMNSPGEIRQAFVDYQQTRFGGWPWPTDDPVHPRDDGRFARHADGRVERKGPAA